MPAINARIEGDTQEVAALGFDPDSIPLWPHAAQYSELGEFVPTSEIMRETLDRRFMCLFYNEESNDCEATGKYWFVDGQIMADTMVLLDYRTRTVAHARGPKFLHNGLLCSDPTKITAELVSARHIPPNARHAILTKLIEDMRKERPSCEAFFRKAGVIWSYSFDFEGNSLPEHPHLPFELTTDRLPLRMPHALVETYERARAGNEI